MEDEKNARKGEMRRMYILGAELLTKHTIPITNETTVLLGITDRLWFARICRVSCATERSPDRRLRSNDTEASYESH